MRGLTLALVYLSIPPAVADDETDPPPDEPSPPLEPAAHLEIAKQRLEETENFAGMVQTVATGVLTYVGRQADRLREHVDELERKVAGDDDDDDDEPEVATPSTPEDGSAPSSPPPADKPTRKRRSRGRS